jgi:hypothetical protein
VITSQVFMGSQASQLSAQKNEKWIPSLSKEQNQHLNQLRPKSSFVSPENEDKAVQ